MTLFGTWTLVQATTMRVGCYYYTYSWTQNFYYIIWTRLSDLQRVKAKSKYLNGTIFIFLQWETRAYAGGGSRKQWNTNGAVRYVGERNFEISISSTVKSEWFVIAKSEVKRDTRWLLLLTDTILTRRISDVLRTWENLPRADFYNE